MKKLSSRWSSLLLPLLFLVTPTFAEDWKGESSPSGLDAGGMAGLGIIDSTAGISILGTVSKKIISKGFVPEINNSVSAELMIGPFLNSISSGFAFSGHLRWDFVKDSIWTFYALGGLGGNHWSVNRVSRISVKPRFGIGTFYHLGGGLRLRAEVTHDFIGVGVNFEL